MAKKVRADYKQAFENLVKAMRFDAKVWRVESDRLSDLDFTLSHRYDGMSGECEYLLEQAEKFEAECKGQLNELGRVSLHLIDRATGICVYDLDCTVGGMPERMWCENMHTVSGNGYHIATQDDHIHHVRMNGAFGVPLTFVWHTEGFYWVNDYDCMVDGPDIWEARYTDTAFALC